MKRTRQAHGLAFSSLLMIVGLFPFGLRSGRGSEASLRARLLS